MTPEPPTFSIDEAAEIARDLYGLDGAIRALPAYYDQNFEIEGPTGSRRVLKIANSSEEVEALDLQHHAVEHLARAGLPFEIPQVIPTRSGEAITTTFGPRGTAHFVRLLSFVEGRLWADLGNPTPDQLTGLGRAVAKLVAGFEGFSHPAMQRELSWDPVRFPSVREHLGYLTDPHRRQLVENILNRFEDFVQPRLEGLPKGVIHSDVNQHNVIINEHGNITGLIDFGDVVHSITVGELAVAMAYSLLTSTDPLGDGRHILTGYQSVLRLEEAELEVVYDLVLERLAMSVTSAARLHKTDPNNVYAFVNEGPGWALIERLMEAGSQRKY